MEKRFKLIFDDVIRDQLKQAAKNMQVKNIWKYGFTQNVLRFGARQSLPLSS